MRARNNRCLFYAACAQYYAFLVSRRRAGNPPSPQDGSTPLYAASLGGHWDAVKALLGLQPTTDVSALG